MNKLQILSSTRKKVFTAQDLAVLWDYSDENKLYELIKHYVRSKAIYSLARGLYSLYNYSRKDLLDDTELLIEISNRLVPNSYVSLSTALKIYGAIFQYDSTIHAIADRKVTRIVLGINFDYRKIKDDVLNNDLGIESKNDLRIANAARAFCDSSYFDPNFDIETTNISNDELHQISVIYNNKKLSNRIEKWIKSSYVKY